MTEAGVLVEAGALGMPAAGSSAVGAGLPANVPNPAPGPTPTSRVRPATGPGCTPGPPNAAGWSGRKACRRSSVIVNPVYSSGASGNSSRP